MNSESKLRHRMKPPAPDSRVNRRSFLTGAAAAGAAASVVAVAGTADPPTIPDSQLDNSAHDRGARAPSAAQRDADLLKPSALEASEVSSSSADFMVDVLESVGLPFVFANPGSSFRGLHESIINYGHNRSPEFITCMHEESAAAMANGYAKAAGAPAGIICHGTVGLQHASMALYNAWCDRVPIIVMLGNTLDMAKRHHAVEWTHSAQDPAALVRDFTKWDDQPTTLQAFAESMVRAYKLATTPPMEPVAIVIDSELQERELRSRADLTIPKLARTIPPQGDSGAVNETARLLVAADCPVLIADRLVRSAAGMQQLVALAEALGAAVIDQGGRQNFPTSHPLCQTLRAGSLIRQADVIVGFEVTDLWGTVNQHASASEPDRSLLRAGSKLIAVGMGDLYLKSNYQDFQRYCASDLAIAGDGEATLSALLEAVESALPASLRPRSAARVEEYRKAHTATYEISRQAAAVGWEASPISTARLCAELWQQIKNEDWSLVSCCPSPWFVNNWPHRLWHIDRHYQYLGGPGAAGVGYGLPAAVGAALANRSLGRFSVNIQSDGDLMYAPGALWTAAHHKIPLLSVMHNNRAYAQEGMLLQAVANRWNRGVDRSRIGTAIDAPFIDYAKLAQSMGVWAEGPITDPRQLAAAIARAVSIVKQGLPALVDVVTQNR